MERVKSNKKKSRKPNKKRHASERLPRQTGGKNGEKKYRAAKTSKKG
jgi:hypothetical protein